MTDSTADETARTDAGTTARIELNTDRCTALGICEAMAPDYFEVQDEGSLLILSAEVMDGDLVDVRSAVQSCPTEALRLVMP